MTMITRLTTLTVLKTLTGLPKGLKVPRSQVLVKRDTFRICPGGIKPTDPKECDSPGCTHDGDCAGYLKCCPVEHCNKRCVTPGNVLKYFQSQATNHRPSSAGRKGS